MQETSAGCVMPAIIDDKSNGSHCTARGCAEISTKSNRQKTTDYLPYHDCQGATSKASLVCCTMMDSMTTSLNKQSSRSSTRLTRVFSGSGSPGASNIASISEITSHKHSNTETIETCLQSSVAWRHKAFRGHLRCHARDRSRNVNCNRKIDRTCEYVFGSE